MIALLASPLSQAADHLDSTALATNPMADINDVYGWMASDGADINLAMTVSPFDDGTNSFGASVQYVFHLTRYTFASPQDFPILAPQIAAGEESKVICTFASNTDGQCWVVDTSGKVVDYVSGDFSAAAGKASASGQTRVFAGPRSDPFFFNLAGFFRARGAFEAKCGGGTAADCPGGIPTNAAKCPLAPTADVKPIRDLLSAEAPAMVGPCPANQRDCFANANVMAIVVQVDKSLIVNDTKPLVGVWGSTHAGQ